MHLKIGIGSRGGLNTFKRYKALGYDCIDLALYDTASEFYTLPKEQAEKLLLLQRSWARESGVELNQCHGPWKGENIYGTKEERAERMRENKHSLWCASVLGIKNWVIHPIFPFGGEERSAEIRKESFKINLEFFSELLETARQYGITICLENMPFIEFGLSQIDSIKSMVDRIGDEHFKICLDTGHVNCFKTHSIGEAVRICGNDLRALHIHDNRGFDTHDIPFFGNIDWESFYYGLSDIGYTGVFNFETAPNWKMSDEIYDDMHRVMIRLAKQIMHADD